MKKVTWLVTEDTFLEILVKRGVKFTVVTKVVSDNLPGAAPCKAVIYHGPGHQSATQCDATGPHKQHRSTNSRLYWSGMTAFSGYFDESPEEEGAPRRRKK